MTSHRSPAGPPAATLMAAGLRSPELPRTGRRARRVYDRDPPRPAGWAVKSRQSLSFWGVSADVIEFAINEMTMRTFTQLQHYLEIGNAGDPTQPMRPMSAKRSAKRLPPG